MIQNVHNVCQCFLITGNFNDNETSLKCLCMVEQGLDGGGGLKISAKNSMQRETGNVTVHLLDDVLGFLIAPIISATRSP